MKSHSYGKSPHRRGHPPSRPSLCAAVSVGHKANPPVPFGSSACESSTTAAPLNFRTWTYRRRHRPAERIIKDRVGSKAAALIPEVTAPFHFLRGYRR
jgi:hypothetical protein